MKPLNFKYVFDQLFEAKKPKAAPAVPVAPPKFDVAALAGTFGDEAVAKQAKASEVAKEAQYAHVAHTQSDRGLDNPTKAVKPAIGVVSTNPVEPTVVPSGDSNAHFLAGLPLPKPITVPKMPATGVVTTINKPEGTFTDPHGSTAPSAPDEGYTTFELPSHFNKGEGVGCQGPNCKNKAKFGMAKASQITGEPDIGTHEGSNLPSARFVHFPADDVHTSNNKAQGTSRKIMDYEARSLNGEALALVAGVRNIDLLPKSKRATELDNAHGKHIALAPHVLGDVAQSEVNSEEFAQDRAARKQEDEILSDPKNHFGYLKALKILGDKNFITGTDKLDPNRGRAVQVHHATGLGPDGKASCGEEGHMSALGIKAPKAQVPGRGLHNIITHHIIDPGVKVSAEVARKLYKDRGGPHTKQEFDPLSSHTEFTVGLQKVNPITADKPDASGRFPLTGGEVVPAVHPIDWAASANAFEISSAKRTVLHNEANPIVLRKTERGKIAKEGSNPISSRTTKTASFTGDRGKGPAGSSSRMPGVIGSLEVFGRKIEGDKGNPTETADTRKLSPAQRKEAKKRAILSVVKAATTSQETFNALKDKPEDKAGRAIKTVKGPEKG